MLCLILIVLVAIEGGSRVYLTYFVSCAAMESDTYDHLDHDTKRKMCNDYDNIIRYRLPHRHHEPNQHFETYNINNEGFRGSEILKEKPANTYRIFVVGGSTVFGDSSTSDNTTIPGYLQQEFDKTNLDFKVEVINAGQMGMYSWGELQTVKNTLIHYNPDLVIIYDGWNDLINPYSLIKDGTTTNSSFEKFWDNLRVNISFYKTLIAGYIIQESIIDATTGNFIFKNFEPNETPEKSLVWENRMKDICEFGKSKNFETMVYLQPFVNPERKPLTEFEQKYWNLWKMESISPSYQYYVDKLDGIENYCTRATSLENVFSGMSEPLFTDGIHLGDRGNQIVAKKIFETVFPVVQN